MNITKVVGGERVFVKLTPGQEAVYNQQLSEVETETERIATENVEKLSKYEELKSFHDSYIDMLYWDGKTDEQISKIIDDMLSGTTAQIISGIGQALKRLARGQRDDVGLFKLIRDAGILPK